MANTNGAFGLRPVRHLSGAPFNGQLNAYFVASDYATNMFIGDPVVVTGESITSGGVTRPVVAVATAGATNQITGVCMGFSPNPSVVSLGYGAASTLRIVYVADAPDIMFEVQGDGQGTVIAIADIGRNINLVSGAGSAYTKKSGWMLNEDSLGGDATYQMTIRGLVEREDNEPAAAYGKYLCTINLHTNRLAAVAGL